MKHAPECDFSTNTSAFPLSPQRRLRRVLFSTITYADLLCRSNRADVAFGQHDDITVLTLTHLALGVMSTTSPFDAKLMNSLARSFFDTRKVVCCLTRKLHDGTD